MGVSHSKNLKTEKTKNRSSKKTQKNQNSNQKFKKNFIVGIRIFGSKRKVRKKKKTKESKNKKAKKKNLEENFLMKKRKSSKISFLKSFLKKR